MLASRFSTVVPLSIVSLRKERAQFKVALRRYLNTPSLYSVAEFLMYKNAL
jgi:hypothetical protein